MLKTPPYLIGAGLVFWGWQTGLWPLAVGMALLLEGSRFVKTRWDLQTADFNRLADLGTLLFIGLIAYFFLLKRSANFLLLVLQWLPLPFLPILAGQFYGSSVGVDISTLFLTLRRRQNRNKPAGRRSWFLNLSYPYFALCLVAASVANTRTPWFYAGLCVLCGWAAWPRRSGRYATPLWIALLISAGLMGYAGQMGLHRLQLLLEDKAVGWLTYSGRKEADPFHAQTALGYIGTLKKSNRILFRVEGDLERSTLLLREAAYNMYHSASWFAQQSLFHPVISNGDPDTWRIGEEQQGGERVVIHFPLAQGKGLLKLPMGTYEIRGLHGLKISQNRFGTVKIEEGAGMKRYTAAFIPGFSKEEPPDQNDMIIPDDARNAVSQIADRLHLQSQPPEEIPNVLDAFFQQHFKYSLSLESGGLDAPVLDRFLLQNRSGHCEYFATATVLLLRATGIPARYITGYAVHEYSKLEKKFVVREKDAHAWALAYMEGAWRDVDLTPAAWLAEENGSGSLIGIVSDLWSWGVFTISAWRGQGGHAGKGWGVSFLLLLLIPVLYMVKRVKRRKKESPAQPKERRSAFATAKPGKDSPFYLIEKRLMVLGYRRLPGETLSGWLKSIQRSQPCIIVDEDDLKGLLLLHYGYRFDPRGLSPEAKSRFDFLVQAWLDNLERHDPS